MDSQAEKIHNISQLLKAYCVYEKDVQYVVKDDKVIIVDENTGREMPGRRWSDGLHQAVEAKEGVQIEKETQTFATITIQNYFRLYQKLAGMTGTAETEAAEFHDIYRLDVLPIPTNTPNIRIDENDQIFKTRREKFNAVIAKIEEAHAKGQPVPRRHRLRRSPRKPSPACSSARKSRTRCSTRSSTNRRPKSSPAPASSAPSPFPPTWPAAAPTSNSAPGVAELGGLFVIGTERHESRRIDRQLRGRCARQGDPGRSQFFISFEDDLMRNFAAADRMTAMMERFGMKEGEALEHSWLNRSVETAQKRVEQRNYTWPQARARFRRRDEHAARGRLRLPQRSAHHRSPARPRHRDHRGNHPRQGPRIHQRPRRERARLQRTAALGQRHPSRPRHRRGFPRTRTTRKPSPRCSSDKVKEAYEARVGDLPMEVLDQEERRMVLVAIDKQWQEHLYNMDALREGVGLRAQGQKDPLIEYKNEAYNLFVTLMESIKQEALQNLFRSATNLRAFEELLASLPQQLRAAAVKTIPMSSLPEPRAGASAFPRHSLRASRCHHKTHPLHPNGRKRHHHFQRRHSSPEAEAQTTAT